MPRLRKANKIPEDWVRCPVCLLTYGFIRCRVTLSDKRDICLICLGEENEQKRLHKETGGGLQQGGPTMEQCGGQKVSVPNGQVHDTGVLVQEALEGFQQTG